MQSEQNINIADLLGILRRRALAIALCALLVGGAAFVYSKHQKKMYTATTSLLFSSAAISQQVAGLEAVNDATSQQSQEDTNVQLVRLGDMARKTAATLGQGLTKSSVMKSLTVSAVGDTNVVDVSAVAGSPTLAADVANTYSNVFVQEQQNANQQYYATALALVTRQLAALSPAQQAGSAGLALQDRAQSLGTLADLRDDTVSVAQAATVPPSPSSPAPVRNAVLATVLGLLIGLGLAFLLERLDRLIREPRDLAQIYDLPLLGAIPESPDLARSTRGDRAPGGSLLSAEPETFQLLRAHLRYFNVDRELKTLLVISAASGDGKTTLSLHLAGAAARLGSKVLLVEADLRRPTMSPQLQLEPGPGLSEVLIGAVSMDDAVREIALDSPQHHAATRTLDLLAAGAVVPPNPAELIESRAMEVVLASAKAAYDLVIVDTPPLTAVSDAFPLLRKVDGVIIVGRMGRDRRDLAQRTRETLRSVGAPLLGVIANGVKREGGSSYYYGYSSYGYASSRHSPSVAEPESVASVSE